MNSIDHVVNACYNTDIDQVVSRKERSDMSVISSEKLTKYYGKNRGIINLDLNVEEGEIYGYIGPNGAGKSTTIKLLLDFIRPTKGGCRIFGLDCISSSAKIKRDIGYIPAEVNYYEGMSVAELLDYSARYYGGGFGQHTDMLCGALELDTSRKITELSTGNKKKVAIVQAMLHKPKLLIMDEPTAGLDPLMQHVFYGLVKEAREGGATIFFSSHILSEVQRVCDRVGIIRDGKLISTQTMEELTATEYKRVKATMAGDISIPGAESMQRHNGTIEFLYKGPADKLISTLAGYHVSNILIEDPPLEDIFMAYYQEGGK
jgi:ABC-2 type transport system ATP-binding protein